MMKTHKMLKIYPFLHSSIVLKKKIYTNENQKNYRKGRCPFHFFTHQDGNFIFNLSNLCFYIKTFKKHFLKMIFNFLYDSKKIHCHLFKQ